MPAESNQGTNNADIKKDIDYFGVLKNAFEIVRKNKYLWFLGILAGSSFGSGGSSGWSGNGNDFSKKGNASTSFDQVISEASKWIHDNWIVILVLAAVLIIFIIIFMVLSVIARAGLTHSVDQLSKNEESSFSNAIKFGWHKFWRVLGSGVLVGLTVLAVFLLLAAPIVALFFVSPIVAVILGFFIGFPFFIIAAIVSGIILEYSLRYISLKDEKIVASIKSGLNLMRTKKKETALIWLMTAGIGIVSGVALIMAIIFAALVLFLLGLVFFILAPIAGIAYAVVAVSAFIIACLLAGGFISSFISAYWTLCFKEIAV